MPLPLLPSFLPLKIRSIIYVMVDELVLVKSHPEVFWALAPHHLRTITIGQSLNFFINPKLLTQLAIMFEAAFPEVYAEYHEAFDAGVWLEEDQGPFCFTDVI